jgi:D-alanyl-lipoteichoic acid acyltransferase DltB (MBOAT superfamily)
MLFNSPEFVFLFLPLAVFVYFILLKYRLITTAKAWLVFSSLFFYSWWKLIYLPLILSSMLFNFSIGSALGSSGASALHAVISRKTLLTVGIASNLALLGFFKYANFFLENINVISGSNFTIFEIALPLAISFFTFQQIAYLVDSYRNETSEYDFLNYALFVTFFPQLIAGPIVHHKDMMPQFASKWNLVKKYRNITLGLCIFGMGLFKKVVIADTFSKWVGPGFDHAIILSFYEAWLTSLSYTFQIYFDFSGYTDMAIGAALLFNIRLPINFNSPYKAVSIQDFWRRWHMTLSRFLRDYLYFPLGGNRAGTLRTYLNLFTTFLLGGLWHGASWMFVLWGALHGLALITHRLWQKTSIALPTAVSWLLTFLFVNFTWVFFRANDFQSAANVIKGMLGINGIATPIEAIPLKSLATYGSLMDNFSSPLSATFASNLFITILIVCALAVVTRGTNSSEYFKKGVASTKLVVCSAILGGIAMVTSLYTSSEVFLYFNF